MKSHIALGILWRVPIILGMVLLNLILGFLGLFLCAFAPAYVEPDATAHWKWKWMWLWDNEEDGVDGLKYTNGKPKNPRWIAQTSTWGLRRTIWMWSAWRNSVNNFRFLQLGISPVYRKPEYLGPTTASTQNDNWWMEAGYKFWYRHVFKSGKLGVKLGWQPGGGWKCTIDRPQDPGA